MFHKDTGSNKGNSQIVVHILNCNVLKMFSDIFVGFLAILILSFNHWSRIILQQKRQEWSKRREKLVVFCVYQTTTKILYDSEKISQIFYLSGMIIYKYTVNFLWSLIFKPYNRHLFFGLPVPRTKRSYQHFLQKPIVFLVNLQCCLPETVGAKNTKICLFNIKNW